MKNKLENYFDSIEIPDNLNDAINSGIKEGKRKKFKRKLYIRNIAAAASFLLIISTFAVYKHYYKPIQYSSVNNSAKIYKTSLPVVGSSENLSKILRSNQNKTYNTGSNVNRNSEASDSNENVANSTEKAPAYSNTNIQVQGVDEDDTVKTDGKYIYYANENEVDIVQAAPYMKLINSITIDNNIIAINGQSNEIRGLYLTNNYLTVISSPFSIISKTAAETSKAVDINNVNLETKITIFDIKNKTNIKKLREISFSGSYLTSRLINSKLYLITNKFMNYDYKDSSIINNSLPYYKDSTKNNSVNTINLKKTPYLPDTADFNFICIGVIDISSLNKEVNFYSFLGSSSCIYTSKNSFYIANTSLGSSYGIIDDRTSSFASINGKTQIYKFDFTGDTVNFAGEGEISGSILNQFSMDENNGFLRVTSSQINTTNSSQTNNIFVLDKNMSVIGKINNIEPRERIYATRFINDKAFVVTFKNTDPLLVIDLKNPAAPKILGKLTIPGFSTYLQPYDETHLIGIGNSTTENNDLIKPSGIKLSLFDITNLSSPKLISTIETDSDYYSNSEALYNHKAFLFSKSKNFIAFPVEASSNKNASYFMGAYIYNIDLNKGLSLKGKISHTPLETENMNNYYPNLKINKIIYINDILYTFSQTEIKANKISDLSEIETLKFDIKK